MKHENHSNENEIAIEDWLAEKEYIKEYRNGFLTETEFHSIRKLHTCYRVSGNACSFYGYLLDIWLVAGFIGYLCMNVTATYLWLWLAGCEVLGVLTIGLFIAEIASIFKIRKTAMTGQKRKRTEQ